MKGLKRTAKLNKVDKLISICSVLIVLGVMGWVLPPFFQMIKDVAGDIKVLVVSSIMILSYVSLLFYVSRSLVPASSNIFLFIL